MELDEKEGGQVTNKIQLEEVSLISMVIDWKKEAKPQEPTRSQRGTLPSREDNSL